LINTFNDPVISVPKFLLVKTLISFVLAKINFWKIWEESSMKEIWADGRDLQMVIALGVAMVGLGMLDEEVQDWLRSWSNRLRFEGNGISSSKLGEFG
jgi:hypothetical protein